MKDVLGRCTFKAALSMIAVLVMTVGGLSACTKSTH
jgi:hypothetical protein